MSATSLSPFKTLKDVVFPAQCAGCGKWDEDLCGQCAALAGQVNVDTQLEDSAGRPALRLLALGAYEGTLRQLILAAKHQSHRDLREFLHHAGLTLGRAAAQTLLEASPDLAEAVVPVAIWVVGAPPSHARRRRREEVVPEIAGGVAQGLREMLTAAVRVVPAAQMRPGASGQSGKAAGKRGLGRHGAMKLSVRALDPVMVVIVDDVVTTGATMREVCRLFGQRVVAGLALAAA